MVLIQINIQYEKLDYCSKEWKKILWELPLEVAYLIYLIALNRYMTSWENQHKYLMWSIPEKIVTITTDYSIEIQKLKKKYEKEKDYTLHITDISKKNFNLSCLEIIENLGIQEQQFVKQFYDTEKCIEVPQKFTTKLCKPVNVNTKITEDYKRLRNERVVEFYLPNIPDDIQYYLTNENRLIYNKNKPTNKFWVENKCRCFTCDLVRYSFRNYTMKDVKLSSIWPKNKRIYASSNCGNRIYSHCEYITSYDWYKTYDNLAVDIEKKQWKRIY
jgi:hypothetical protein